MSLSDPDGEKPIAENDKAVNSFDTKQNKISSIYKSPFQLLIIIALSIFFSEISVMIILIFLQLHSTWIEVLLDSFLLVVLLSPVFYYFLFKPLVMYMNERKPAEEALRKSREWYRNVGDNALEGVLVLDEGAKMSYVNSRMAEMLGFSVQEMLGRSLFDFMDDTARHEAQWCFEQGKRGIKERLDFHFRRKDGQDMWAIVSCNPILDENSLLINVLGFITDITERKKAEKSIREAEEKYHKLIEIANDAIFVADAETGIILEANKKAEELLGLPVEKIIGLHQTQLHPAEETESYARIFRDAIKRGKVISGDNFVCHRDGHKIPVEISASVIEILGKNVILGIFRDVTERKKAEELRLENIRLEYASKAKSEFLANMSHELRTPLVQIIGFTELLKKKVRGELNESQEHYVDNISTSSHYLLKLMNDILDLNKVEEGRIELVIEPIPVAETVNEALTFIKEQAARNNIILKKDIDPELGLIEADPQRFKQILLNLLSNAVKFSKKGGGVVTITAKKANDMAQFSVSDTGIGIREEDIGKLFKKFERGRSGKTGEYEGTGLGLMISKQLVELHKGKITVESKFGEGSTFTFSLPLKK